MKTYIAMRGFNTGALVMVHEWGPPRPLERHRSGPSPTGHAWGYGGAGPHQLALDLLWDLYGLPPAHPLVMDFKFNVIAAFPMDSGWKLNEIQVRTWVSDHGGFSVAREAIR